ncbi:MAG TPA: response regulator transcription factor [Geobacterales bacterium]|nr:response regulator transcription factor [Geobacterales bacterium]
MNVLLADDHQIVREGVRHLLERQEGVRVIAMADNGRQAVQLATELQPDLVVMDLTMPELNGIEATRQIVASYPEIRVLVLSMHSDRRFVDEALAAGASGYLLKESAAEELVEALQQIAAGERYLSPRISSMVTAGKSANLHHSLHSPLTLLSSRERQVLQLIAEGKNTKEIAFLLEISVKTIETHRQQVMKKLGIFSVAELTRFALREGITPL